MKKINHIQTIFFAATLMLFTACKKDYGNLNGPTVENYQNNATVAELKKEAQDKLNAAISEEQQNSKVESTPSNTQ